jgi:hypothetical protein
MAALGIKAEVMKLDSDEDSEELADAVDIDTVPFILPIPADYYPADIWENIDEYEKNLPPSQFFRLLRRQIRWAEEEDAELVKELADLRSSAEDLHGNILRRGAGDEKGADENRKFESHQTDRILEEVLRAELARAQKLVDGEKDVGSGTNSWQMIKDLDTLVNPNEEA